MDPVALVIAGHLVGDWIVQTDRQAVEKTSSWKAMHAHCATYHVTLALFMLPAWRDWRLAALVAVSWVTHAFIDRRWPVRVLLEWTGSASFSYKPWGVIAVDQALHLAILLVCVAALAA